MQWTIDEYSLENFAYSCFTGSVDSPFPIVGPESTVSVLAYFNVLDSRTLDSMFV